MGSVNRQENGTYRARYRDDRGREHHRRFKRQAAARAWVKAGEAAVQRGDHLDRKAAETTVSAWVDRWLEGYASRRPSTLRQAQVHCRVIVAEFGDRRLSDIRPSDVSAWVAKLGEKYADSTRYAIYRRFAQVMADAAQDGLIPRSPCSRRTAPPQGSQRPYVATTEQVWGLHDALPEHLRPAVLLGAFAGLRISEVCGLRPKDIDIERATVTPAVQWGGAPLKSASSAVTIPVPEQVAQELPTAGETILTDPPGKPVAPHTLERAIRTARVEVTGLPEGFRHHDLRHFYASALIAAGLDVKTVQARLRHASATTTLNTYGHLMPDADDRSRAAMSAVFTDRPAANLRPAE